MNFTLGSGDLLAIVGSLLGGIGVIAWFLVRSLFGVKTELAVVKNNTSGQFQSMQEIREDVERLKEKYAIVQSLDSRQERLERQFDTLSASKRN